MSELTQPRWVVRDPIGAAHAAQGIGHLAVQAASALVTLTGNLWH